ncbi:MAG: ACT domain-containing protein [Kangiellaceae bacterium]|jgi:glycine cleavage system transcriptional repressor|nr:ACT domain-containing protein [Kangiellaceae bacterium]
MSKRLIISAIAPNQPGMASRITQLIEQAGACIEESHMTVMSNEFALIMELSGPHNVLVRLEHQLPTQAQQLGMLTTLKRSDKSNSAQPATPYRVIVTKVDDRQTINRLTNFFAEHKINIEEINCRTLLAPHSEEMTGEIKMTITPSNDLLAEQIRTKFNQLCTELKLSAEISPLIT